jgi:hypothetical protein
MEKGKEAVLSLVEPEASSTHEAEPVDGLVELVLAEHEARSAPAVTVPSRIDGVLIGRLAALGVEGEPLVEYPGSSGCLAARSMAALGVGDVGREVALLFEGGNPGRPVVMGLMHVPQPAGLATTSEATRDQAAEAEADGERLVFTAEKEIVLRCGEASITLTRAGKIIIRGAYLLSRSSGTNRIQGGSVEIN